jgi:addiction module RelE/StbE family toxin
VTIDYHSSFKKCYIKLSPKQKLKVQEAIGLFVEDPRNPKIRHHALTGKYKPQMSISAGGDLRLHYVDKGNGLIAFVKVGSHSELYG